MLYNQCECVVSLDGWRELFSLTHAVKIPTDYHMSEKSGTFIELCQQKENKIKGGHFEAIRIHSSKDFFSEIVNWIFERKITSLSLNFMSSINNSDWCRET